MSTIVNRYWLPQSSLASLQAAAALDWIVERYQIKTDKASGIVNDPNDWSREHEEPRYIIDLIGRIVTVSLETNRIVDLLPSLGSEQSKNRRRPGLRRPQNSVGADSKPGTTPRHIERYNYPMVTDIASLRKQAGLSQTRLAELSGISQPNISAIEAGRRAPRPETLSRLIAALRPRPSQILIEHREATLELARKHKVHHVRVFGSAVRGEDTPNSDIDLLVDLEPGASLFDLTGFHLDLEDLLGVKVDVIAAGGDGPIMEHILQEAVAL